MVKELFHPNAWLSGIRNTRLGLRARSKVLYVLERVSGDARAVSGDAGLRYGVVMHHLRLLGAEGIVERKGSRPYVWVLTGVGQRRLQVSG